jgi:hypothetical protein
MRWIIGDVHGMLRPLEAVLAAVRAADPEARLYFTGDYVNRGPDSRKVVDLLLTLPNARFIRGNHDDIFDQVLSGHSYTCGRGDDERLMAFDRFMRFGMDQTFLSYGEDLAMLQHLVKRPRIEGLEKLIESVPPAHRTFFRELPLVIEEADVFIAHALWDPLEPSESPSLADRLRHNAALQHRILWGRFEMEQISGAKAWRRTGFFGHTPTLAYDDTGRRGPLPIAGPRIVLLDTGAFDREGRLTAFCADAGSFVQADHFGKLI